MFQELFCISFISSSANHVEILFLIQHWKIKEHNSYILHRMGLLMIIRILIISFSLYHSFRPQNKVSFKWYWKLISINKIIFNKPLYYLHVFNVFFILDWLPRAITGPHLGCQPPLLLQMARERPSTSWRSEADSNSRSVCQDDCSTVRDSSSPHDHEVSNKYINFLLNIP